MYQGLLWQFVRGVIFPGIITIVLCFLGLELTIEQMILMTPLILPSMLFYSVPEALLVRYLCKPLGLALGGLDAGNQPPPGSISRALVRALNLPYYAFLRITLVRGILAGCVAFLSLWLTNLFRHGDFQQWQMVMFPALVFFFACPAYAMIEYFLVSRKLVPVVERLWHHCTRLTREDQKALIAVRLKTKLLYLCIFITALPLLFIALTVFYKVHLLMRQVGVADPLPILMPLLKWLAGALVVCMGGALMVSLMTADEVSRAASRLIGGMNEVERGNLDVDLKVHGTDEYADLTRGFNLMTDGLRDEVRLLEVSQDLAGELQLEVLIARIMRAASELLDAERSTLFMHDAEKGELWSRFADGLTVREIRIPDTAGIAGAVFTNGKAENIADVYQDPRFNQDVDKRTGYRTRSIICMPIVNKAGKRIGVTQVLNKKDGGTFHYKDQQRLSAFTAQIAVTLENAQLFDEVLAVKNYNDNILASTTNGVITLNNNRAVVTANDAALRILGLAGENIFDRAVQNRFTDANPWVVKSVVKVQGTGRNDVAVDTELIRADGSKASVNLTTVPLRNAQGESLGFMMNFEDFTSEKRVKTTMARYMSKEVAEKLLEAGESALGGSLQTVSILFSDVRGFTSVAEAYGPKETVSMLNEYFEQMVETIFQHKGILDKYIGDAIMALFGAPFEAADDADRAVATANGMLVALAVLNTKRAEQGRPPLEVGIGIATGEVIVGNIGSPRRMEYTVIGDSVNLASRLESATKQYGVRVLLAESTVMALKVPTLLRELDLMRVKGKDYAVSVYEALGHHDERSFPAITECLAHWQAALKAYRERDFDSAQAGFNAVLQLHPGDKPSRLYIERCMHYRRDRPPADWDWVWNLREK